MPTRSADIEQYDNCAFTLLIAMVAITQFSQNEDSCGFSNDRVNYKTEVSGSGKGK